MKVHMEEISEDRSPGKRNSHARLLSLVNALTHKGLMHLYTKSELQRLCSRYDVYNLTRWNKEKLALELALAISHSEHMSSHQVTSRYAVDIVNEPGQPCRDIPLLKICCI